jgi:hypothetical protein
MCAMPDSNMAPAIRESSQADFSHGLLGSFQLSIGAGERNRTLV